MGPFHADELRAQQLAGGGAAGGGIRAFMPDQHRRFFEALPYLFLGVSDSDGWPLATMLAGAPGFLTAPDPWTLAIDGRPADDDPAAGAIAVDAEIGLLGIELATRRRNRANGRVAAPHAGGFTVAVEESFGNCPQYIQVRTVRRTGPRVPQLRETLADLDQPAQALITRADTFFVASRARAGGADVSHRGGRPGFVGLSGDTLVIPDFRGNRYFNTLGNLLGEPRAGLLFVDFESGDMLQLQGRAEIEWDGETAAHFFAGAERIWRFHVARGWRRRAALPFAFDLVEASPFLAHTGTWPAIAGGSSARLSDPPPAV